MTFVVAWGRDPEQPDEQHRTEVSTPGELDTVLDRLAAESVARVVDVYPTDYDPDDLLPPVLQLGIATGARSFLTFLGEPPGWGYDPALPPTTDTIVCDYGGTPTAYGPDRLTVTTPQARDATRAYVTTGRRPDVVAWLQDIPA